MPIMITRAEQMLEELPPHLANLARPAEMFYSPIVLRYLNRVWERRRGVR